jgi:hypothetical protein
MARLVQELIEEAIAIRAAIEEEENQ